MAGLFDIFQGIDLAIIGLGRLFIIVGLLLIVLGVVAYIKDWVQIDKAGRIIAFIFGLAFIAIGLYFEPIPNQEPSIQSFISDMDSPQSANTSVTWTTIAFDKEYDTIYYKFSLKGPWSNNVWRDTTSWQTSNTWRWLTSNADTGTNQIRVLIRDGKHAKENGFDDIREAEFKVKEQNDPPVLEHFYADKKSPQPTSASINFTAIAFDKEKDQLYYQFLINGPRCAGNWWEMTNYTTRNHWKWETFSEDIGESQIKVRIIDGEHSLGFDKGDSESVVKIKVV